MKKKGMAIVFKVYLTIFNKTVFCIQLTTMYYQIVINNITYFSIQY